MLFNVLTTFSCYNFVHTLQDGRVSISLSLTLHFFFSNWRQVKIEYLKIPKLYLQRIKTQWIYDWDFFPKLTYLYINHLIGSFVKVSPFSFFGHFPQNDSVSVGTRWPRVTSTSRDPLSHLVRNVVGVGSLLFWPCNYVV